MNLNPNMEMATANIIKERRKHEVKFVNREKTDENRKQSFLAIGSFSNYWSRFFQTSVVTFVRKHSLAYQLGIAPFRLLDISIGVIFVLVAKQLNFDLALVFIENLFSF